MLEKISEMDFSVSNGLQNIFLGTFIDDFCLYLSNPFFWAPYLIFLALLAMQMHAGKHWIVLLFGLGSFIISFQASIWISEKLGRLAPFVSFAGQTDPKIFIHRGEQPWSLPDWAIAAMVASSFYALFILRSKIPGILKWIICLAPLLLAFARVEKGLCFPTDVLAAYAVGIGAGFLLSRFPENLDTIFGEMK